MALIVTLCVQDEVEWVPLTDDPTNERQRWLLVRFEPAYQCKNKTFLRKHERNFEVNQKIWLKWCGI